MKIICDKIFNQWDQHLIHYFVDTPERWCCLRYQNERNWKAGSYNGFFTLVCLQDESHWDSTWMDIMVTKLLNIIAIKFSYIPLFINMWLFDYMVEIFLSFKCYKQYPLLLSFIQQIHIQLDLHNYIALTENLDGICLIVTWQLKDHHIVIISRDSSPAFKTLW